MSILLYTVLFALFVWGGARKLKSERYKWAILYIVMATFALSAAMREFFYFLAEVAKAVNTTLVVAAIAIGLVGCNDVHEAGMQLKEQNLTKDEIQANLEAQAAGVCFPKDAHIGWRSYICGPAWNRYDGTYTLCTVKFDCRDSK